MEEKKENEVVDMKSTDKHAKRKNILLLVLDILLFGLLSVSFASCVLQNREGVANASSVPTPLFLDKAEAQGIYEDTIKITNYTDNNIQFEYNYPSDSTIYNHVISPNETYYAKVNLGSYNYVYMTSSAQVFYLSDDFNIKDFGYSKEFVCESFNGSYIDIYSNYGVNYNDEVYLDLTGEFNPNTNKAINVLGEVLPTNVFRDKTVEIPFAVNGSYFHLDFTQDYINFPNNFNKFVLEYHITPNGYSYNWYSNIYAVSSNTKVLIASTYEIDYPYIYETSENGVRILTVGVDMNASKKDFSFTYGQYFHLAPYLKTTKINGTFGNYSNANVIGFRSFVSSSYKDPLRYKVMPFEAVENGDIWNDIGNLFLVTFMALMPIANIQLFPFVTIGALLIAPLVLAFVMLILRLLKK